MSYPVAQVSLTIAKTQTSSGDTEIQTEFFCFHMVWNTASSFSVMAPEKARLRTFQLRVKFTHGRQATFSVEYMGTFFDLLTCCFFLPEKYEFCLQIYVVSWYISCSLPKHAGCTTNEMEVDEQKYFHFFCPSSCIYAGISNSAHPET